VLAPPGMFSRPTLGGGFAQGIRSTMTDPDFHQGARNAAAIRDTSGEEVERIVSAMVRTPRTLIGKAQAGYDDAEAGAQEKTLTPFAACSADRGRLYRFE